MLRRQTIGIEDLVLDRVRARFGCETREIDCLVESVVGGTRFVNDEAGRSVPDRAFTD